MDRKLHSNLPQPVYVLRVSIKETKPSIWRELSVPADCTLGELTEFSRLPFEGY
jgi:hypothetical protein